MISAQYILPIAHEMIVDLFAGGGGASCGIEQALRRHVDVAINHDPQAVALHQANHPQTQHFVSDVFEVDPRAVTQGRPVGLLWASPDCKHFSKAKGGKPVSKRIRSLAWVVVKWARLVAPRLICLENVEEFQHWGPLLDSGMPCPQRKGSTFRRWIAQLRGLGYAVEWRELRACDYGAPTIRKRLFLIARRDGQPIAWPAPTHAQKPAKGSGLKPWRTAAECIDWSIKCPSIFERARPLAEATLRRIAHGIKRYVLDNPRPYIVPSGQAAPVLTEHANASSPRCMPIDEPLRTICAHPRGGHHALVTAFLARHYGDRGQRPGTPMDEPISTVTAVDHHSLVASHLVKLRGTSNSAATDAPLHTISAGGWHHAEVRALLIKYYGTDQDPRIDEPLHTVTTKDRFGLVTVAGEDYAIADIGLRMLQPRELYRAQGFPDAYIIDCGADGRSLPKDAQVRMCGNSVCPPIAAALVGANYLDLQARRAA